MPVNNFFAHWIREMGIKSLDDDLQIICNSPFDMYRNSDAMLENMPKDALRTFVKHLLYSRTKIVMPTGKNRRNNDTSTIDDRNDASLL